MAELGIIASVVQIADVGLRLSIKLYTFGEIVASADRSVISISKDVSLTSGVLKELGQLLDKDRTTGTFSENAVQTADGVVKECLEVFQEMENILVKKMPSLASESKPGKGGERVKRATVMLERLKWGYLQPKLQLLQSNLDRLKSTLLLMFNVITCARQMSGNTEPPSVIAEQKSLIEDLAHSNQEYIRKFEMLRLGIEETQVKREDKTSDIGAVEWGPNTTGMSLPEKMKFATRGPPLHDKENTRGLGSGELATVTMSPGKAQGSVTRSLATPPNANTSNAFINTPVQTNFPMPPVQQRGIPTTEAPTGSDQEVLFKQLEHYSMLIKNLLKEVEKAQYKITFKSRLRVKGSIAGLHESERQELEKIWGYTALQCAEQRLDSLALELPRNRPQLFDMSEKRNEFPKFKPNAFIPSSTELVNYFRKIPEEKRGDKRGRIFSEVVSARKRPRIKGAVVGDTESDEDELGIGGGGADISTRAKASPVGVPSPLRPSAEEQSETILKEGTNSAVPDQLFSQPEDTAAGGFTDLDGEVDKSYSMPFNSDLNNSDILENFDFEQFLRTADGDSSFDPSTFENRDGLEITPELKSKGPFVGIEGCHIVSDGFVGDKDGYMIGRLVDGNPKSLVGSAVNQDGHIVNEHGSIIGHAKPFEELEFKNAEASLAGKPGLAGDKQDYVIGRPCLDRAHTFPTPPTSASTTSIGRYKSGFHFQRAVDEDGDIIDKYGNVKGHAAELSEDPEEDVADEIVDTSPIEGKVVSRPGKVVKHGTIFGDTTEGDVGEEQRIPISPSLGDRGWEETPYLVDHLISLWTTVKAF